MGHHLDQNRAVDLYNHPYTSYDPSLSISTYPHGLPLEACSSQSSHSTTGSYDSGCSDLSSPILDSNSPVGSVVHIYPVLDTTGQTRKSKTRLSSSGKMSYSGSVSPTRGQLHHCLAGGGCEYRTDRHTDLKRHYKAKHPCPGEEMFQCSYKSCKKEFTRKDHLRDHCKRVHYRDLPVGLGGTGGKLR